MFIRDLLGLKGFRFFGSGLLAFLRALRFRVSSLNTLVRFRISDFRFCDTRVHRNSQPSTRSAEVQENRQNIIEVGCQYD